MSFMDDINHLFTPAVPTVSAMPVVPDAPAVCAPVAPVATIPGLEAAIRAVAPHADLAVWVPAFTVPLLANKVTDAHSIAGLLGQCAVESGGLTTLSENTCYSSAQRLCQIFPSEFPSIASTTGYVGNATKIANRVYANRMGNGDEASGDGFAYRGAGALQCTGKSTVTQIGLSVGKSPKDTADWLRTPDGAAAGAVWFWVKNGLSQYAATCSWSTITRHVNGPAMLGNAQRINASNAALVSLNAA